jgi:prevent-host-death family protein
MSILPSTEISAGVFKATCLQLMDEVHDKHITLVITKRGKPVAKLVPIDDSPVDLFGCMRGTATINGDIVAPIDEQWNANE